MDTIKIGKFISERRRAAGLTQQELAEKLSVTNKAVSKWETGQGAPDIGLLTELAKALHVTVDELLQGESCVLSPVPEGAAGSSEKRKAKYTLQFAVTHRLQLLSAKTYWQEFYLWPRLLCLFAGIFLLALAVAAAGFSAFTSRSVSPLLTVLPAAAGICCLFLCLEGYRFLKAFRKPEGDSCSVQFTDDGFTVSRNGTAKTWRYDRVTKFVETAGLLAVFCGREAVFLQKQSLPEEQWQALMSFLRTSCTGAKCETASKKSLTHSFGLVFAGVAFLALLFQAGYLILHAKYSVAYQAEWVMYLINFIAILFAFLSTLLLAGKKPVVLVWVGILCGAMTVADITGALSTAAKTQDILSASPDGQNTLILKRDISTGKIMQYHNPFLCFARPYQQFSYTVYGNPKIQWLTGDICAITYVSEENGPVHQMVATFGDRGRDASYYVEAALDGSWEPSGKNTAGWKLVRDTKGIVLSNGSTEYDYSTKDCVQYGLTSIVLCKNQVPQWAVALNEDCKIDPKTLLVSYGGTLTLCQVSMSQTAPLVLRSTSKSSGSDSQTLPQTSEKDTYRVQDDVLSFTWDYGHRWTALNLSKDAVGSILQNGSATKLADGCWHVSDNFSYVIFGRSSLTVLFTPNQGKTWETYPVTGSSDIGGGIASRYVVFTGNGFAAVAVGLAGTHDYKGSLLYTIDDSGETWKSRQTPSTQTLTGMNFLSPEVGYLSYTDTAGDHGELYETTDGGKSFTKVILPAGSLSETGNSAVSGLDFGQVYDTPQVPYLENGVPVLYVTQGSDGDFGTYRARYSSKDDGKTWQYVDQEKTPSNSNS